MNIEKFEKFLANLNDKAEYVIYIRNLNEALNHRLGKSLWSGFI